jgi:L-malate glycosyltransferase
MRILYVSDALSIHTRRWAEAFRDRGDEVHVASFRGAQLPGVQVHVLPTLGLGKLGYFVAVPMLRALRARVQPDVVHAQYVTSYGFLAALAALHPLVVTAWGSDVLISPRESRLSHALASFAVRRADAVTTVAEHMNAAVVALGVPPAGVSAVPFGIDTEQFCPPAQPPAEGGVLRVLCTRNLQPIYSVNTVLEAVARVRGAGLAVELDLTGDGSLRGALEAQAQQLGLAPGVRFHGHVDHPRLVSLLQAAHVFVSPALSDGNNVSLNEAMGCGAFPIATHIPANAQWIEHGRNGMLYPPGDAVALAICMQAAAADAALRREAARTNRQIVIERADWRVCVQHMVQTYERLRGQRAAPQGAVA